MMKRFVFIMLILVTPALVGGCLPARKTGWLTNFFDVGKNQTEDKTPEVQHYPIPPRPDNTKVQKPRVNPPRSQARVTVRPILFDYEVVWSTRADQFVLTATPPQVKPLERAHKVRLAITVPGSTDRHEDKAGRSPEPKPEATRSLHAKKSCPEVRKDNKGPSELGQERPARPSGKEIIYFPFGSAVITPPELAKLHHVASRITKSHSEQVSVTGYTCWIGPKDVNEKLALARAMAVVHELARDGVKVGSVSARAKCCYIDLKNPLPNRRAEILWERR